MAPTTFHYFPMLPKGIREAIWATAIRSDHPGAQIFTVYDTSIEAERKLLSEYTLGPPKLGGYALAAPLLGGSDDSDGSGGSDGSAGSNDQNDQDSLDELDVSDNQDDLDNQDDSNNSGNSSDSSYSSYYDGAIGSWVKGNESTYLIDAGLWTACRESRAMVERRFEKSKDQDVNDKEDISDARAATWFVVNGESLPIRCLTYPQTDLFYLILLGETIDWKRTSGLPLSRHLQYRVSHVAVESDIRGGWKGKEGQCMVKAASGELSWARNLWFINYDIIRRADASPVRRGRDHNQYRHRFYGNGYTFTEVRPYDVDWYVDAEVSVADFLGRLEIEVTDYCTKRDKAVPPYRSGGHESRYIGDRPQIGVLAREKCAS